MFLKEFWIQNKIFWQHFKHELISHLQIAYIQFIMITLSYTYEANTKVDNLVHRNWSLLSYAPDRLVKAELLTYGWYLSHNKILANQKERCTLIGLPQYKKGNKPILSCANYTCYRFKEQLSRKYQ